MATHIEQVLEHPIYKYLKETQSLLEGLNDQKFVDHFDQISRLSYILNYCGQLLQDSDVQLVTITQLNNLYTHMLHIKTEMESYVSENNPLRIENSLTRAEELLNYLSRFPQPYQSSPQLKTLLKEQEEQSQKLISVLKRKSSDFEKKTETIETYIQLREKELGELHDLHKVKMTEELSRIAEEITAQKFQLNELSSQFTQLFTSSQEKRLDTFNNEIKGFTEKVSTLLKSQEDEFTKSILSNTQTSSALYDNLEKSAQKVLNNMADMEKKTSQLLEVVGIESFAGHSKKQADKERRVATLFQWIALAILLAMVVYLIFPSSSPKIITTERGEAITVETPSKQEASLLEHSHEFEDAIKHILFSLIFLLPALYAAFESAKHRRQEYKNRQFELEMAAVHPYFAAIPDCPEKNNKRIELADRFFGHENNDEVEAWMPPAIKGAKGILKEVGNLIEKTKN